MSNNNILVEIWIVLSIQRICFNKDLKLCLSGCGFEHDGASSGEHGIMHAQLMSKRSHN